MRRAGARRSSWRCSPAAAGRPSCASRPSSSPPGQAPGEAPQAPAGPSGGVRIAVVTHGQASSPFWAIVRNGVEAAARQMDVVVNYRAPDVYSAGAHEGLIDQAVATRARRARRLDPRARPGARDPPRGPGRHPGRLDQLRQRRLSSRLGVLAHVGQPEEPRGVRGRPPAGRRRRAAGAVRQPADRQHRASTRAAAAWRGRCAAPAAARACSASTTRAPRRRAGSPTRSRSGRHRRRAGPELARAASRRSRACADGRPTRSKVGDVRPRPRRAARRARPPAAVRGRPAGLPAGLPADRDARPARALRALPRPGRRPATGPNFVTRATRARRSS